MNHSLQNLARIDIIHIKTTQQFKHVLTHYRSIYIYIYIETTRYQQVVQSRFFQIVHQPPEKQEANPHAARGDFRPYKDTRDGKAQDR